MSYTIRIEGKLLRDWQGIPRRFQTQREAMSVAVTEVKASTWRADAIEFETHPDPVMTPDKCADCGEACAGERCFIHAAWARKLRTL